VNQLSSATFQMTESLYEALGGEEGGDAEEAAE
jgi:hypothetical protein